MQQRQTQIAIFVMAVSLRWGIELGIKCFE